jgi:hypothetical protein
MKKHSRNQEKKIRRNILSEDEKNRLEELDYCDYSQDWEGVPFYGCNCDKCLFVRTSELKIRLYEKYKNKIAIETLGSMFQS